MYFKLVCKKCAYCQFRDYHLSWCKGIRCSKTAIIRAKCGGLTQHSPLDLEPFDTHDKSVTPQGSHLSRESGLSCVPSATGHFYRKSSWPGKRIGMLMSETIDALP